MHSCIDAVQGGGKVLEQYKLTLCESHVSNLKWVDTLIELEEHRRHQARSELSCMDAEKTCLGGGRSTVRVFSTQQLGRSIPAINNQQEISRWKPKNRPRRGRCVFRVFSTQNRRSALVIFMYVNTQCGCRENHRCRHFLRAFSTSKTQIAPILGLPKQASMLTRDPIVHA
jgi:hypothetical protein